MVYYYKNKIRYSTKLQQLFYNYGGDGRAGRGACVGDGACVMERKANGAGRVKRHDTAKWTVGGLVASRE
jgi:hypothetical protein